MFDWQFEAMLAIRLVVAALLAGVIGYEREEAGKPAGLRTIMIVAVGTALFAATADLLVVRRYPHPELLRLDPIRVVTAVATGIGFLGAGVIVFTREKRIKGLTTAATIWTAAAISLATGFGHYIIAILATALSIAILRGLERFEQAMDQLDDRPERRPD